MPLRETAKQRAKRIDGRVLDGSRWLERGRFILAGIAAVVAIGWWGAGMHFRRADAWASPGPVAAVHATWANDCNACHTDFQAIRDDALLASRESRSIADAKCQRCHRVAHEDDPFGPFGHHALADNAQQLGCSTCHHEHRGSSQALARTSDDNCTVCHARKDLAKLATGKPIIADLKPVTQFAANGHPFFRSLGDPERGPDARTSVPRHLKFARFSHQLHMMPGMAMDGDHQAIWTLGQISEADRTRYAKNGQALSEPVQLDCGSCHQSESRGFGLTKIGGLPDAVLPGNSSGAYMLPITYENQCRACHALTIEPCADVVSGAALGNAAASKPCDTVPHRLVTGKLAEEVEKYWQDRYFKEHPTALRPLSPLPGSSAEPENQAASEWVRQQSQKSAAHLNRVCSKCHQFTGDQVGQRQADADELVEAIIPRVAPVDIPQQRLAHAKFDHSAHRAVDCSECHQEAYPVKGSGVPASPEEAANPEPKQSPLMIANRDKCLECHSPRQEGAEAALGGARFDCAECHRFHNHDDATSEMLNRKPQ
jgi:hypothetical protein